MRTAETTIDQLEQLLVNDEANIARIRARQIATLHALDVAQVRLADGSRTLAEWAAARMDLAPDTAEKLVQTTHRLQDQAGLAEELREGTVSFDRVVEEARLVAAGAEPELVGRSRGWDLAGIRRQVAHHRRIRRPDEQQTYRDRFLAIQPALDQASYKLWGLLPGTDGRVLEQALQERADRFPTMPDRRHCPRTQRNADAIVALAQDSLDGNQTGGTTTAPLVSIFVDADLADRTNGEAGASIDTGPRIGPLTLEEILCDGSAEILMTGTDGVPLTVGPTSRTIPPKLRRFILHRDGGACTADSCRSRYRLQPHHIIPRSQGGTHDSNNLTTLCWFHHHLVIHRNGYRIDPDSPPQKRRFIQPDQRSPP
jgi:hypothetical protein